LRVVGGERRHMREYTVEGIWRGSWKRAENSRGLDCICKMKAIRDRRKPCF
jgi:hypothetical protein